MDDYVSVVTNIQKLCNGAGQNLKNNTLSVQISTVNPFINLTKEDKNKEYINHNEENIIYTSKKRYSGN